MKNEDEEKEKEVAIKRMHKRQGIFAEMNGEEEEIDRWREEGKDEQIERRRVKERGRREGEREGGKGRPAILGGRGIFFARCAWMDKVYGGIW